MHTFTKFKYHHNAEVPYNIAFMHRGTIPSFLQQTRNLRISPRLPGPLGAQGWVQSRSCIKPKYPVFSSPTTLLLCTKSEFQLFIWRTWNHRAFTGISRGPRAPGVRLGKKLHKIKTCYFEVPYNFAFMDQVRIPTFYFANLWSQGFSWTFQGPWGTRAVLGEKVA